MTPPVPDTAPAGGGGFDFDSRLDSSFAETAAPEVSETAETPEPQTAPEPPDGEALPEQEAAAETPVVNENGDGEEEFVDDAGRKHYQVKPERMRGFVADKNFVKAISDFAPTIEDARSHYESASDFRALQSDFASGEQEGVQNFMGFWANGAPEAFQSMATQMPGYLAKLAGSGNPGAEQALRAIEGQVHRADVSTLYAKAAQTKDPADLYAAQFLDFKYHGKYHDSLEKIPQRAVAQPVDQLAQREQAFEQRLKQEADRQWNDFDSNSIGGAKEQILTSSVDAAFRPFEASFAGAPGLLSAAKREATAQVQAELTKQFEWNRNQTVEQKDIQRDFLRAIRSGEKTDLSPRAAALVNSYQSKVKNALPGIVKSLIGERTQAVMQQSAQTHQRLAQGAAKTAPGAGGRPAPRSITPMHPRQSVGDRLDTLMPG